MHTSKGLVPIKNIKEGDMVVTRHEGEGPSVTHLRRVDQVRKQLVPTTSLVVLRMGDEDIWATPDHLFFEKETGSWIESSNLTTSHSLHGLRGKTVKLQRHIKASELLASSDGEDLTTVYDLSVYEYDRYSVGKDGILVSSCNQLVDLVIRDKAMWDLEDPIFKVRLASFLTSNKSLSLSTKKAAMMAEFILCISGGHKDVVDYLNRISIIADCRICNNHQYNMTTFSFYY